ncbi:NAD(P)/FAD-dependent oxidoreductase [Sphingomonas paeninsulae]|uniref:NAD(P)/FAD-dependent oxidoreductase n=1 Tax=Sphingomonas paeninsulae TaxID=2319844 RepID=A0A494TC28_SPHPE|nr:NAD(P)/FAD-dependent oxidoreductase [Sphingomonas paeninsulae]AYJ86710.1 NAD(P)/FAD-dependent oxidoreductase [Sphingomonas paeninsulae]
MNYDAIILGAGAAGLMCAAKAGQRERRILLIDHADEPGKKILISGGGRCNFTNSGTVPERFLSANPHFAKSALGRYSPQDFIALVDGYGITWHEKTLGQLFCDGSARQIVAMLLEEMPDSVTLNLGEPITDVSHSDGKFAVTVGGVVRHAPSLVIATGGPSIPKMGATSFAYDLARKFGLKIIEPRPALVPLTLGGEDVLFRELSGVAAPTRVRCGKTVFEEASLFTHRGLSGPAILQISSYWRHGEAIGIDFLPGIDASTTMIEAKRARPKATVRSILNDHLPARLAGELAERLSVTGTLADQADRRLIEAAHQLNDWCFKPNGTEGYAKAEVTLGGIDTATLSQRTMEAKSIARLFAIGEAVDVTGWLGGYNFQWAWASAAAAAEAV